jgi:sarcosine oxidase subunit alpha
MGADGGGRAKSRATLKIVDGITLNDETFPYLAAKEISVLGGMSARLFRISFSGEHAYELAVPADYGNLVARSIMQAGEEFGIAPYGIEALSIMRIERAMWRVVNSTGRRRPPISAWAK